MSEILYSTIIIPFHLIKKEKNCNIDTLADMFYKDVLSCDKSWKLVNEADELFEGGVGSKDENKAAEYNYFYEEVVRVLYSNNGNSRRSFTKELSNDINVEELNGFIPKKVYLQLTHTGTGSLTIEFVEKEEVDIDTFTNIISEINGINIFKTITASVDDKYVKFPFGGRVFGAAYQSVDNEDIVDNGMTNNGIVINNTCILKKGSGEEKNLMDFFAHKLQIFNIVIIQRTELLRMSAIASYLATNITKEANVNVIADYTLFKNQYDFIECTPDYDGQKFYLELRNYYNMPSSIEQLENQIEALNIYISSESDKRTNRLLNRLSILAIFSALVDGTDYALNYLFAIGRRAADGPNICHLICSVIIVAILVVCIICIPGIKKEK